MSHNSANLFALTPGYRRGLCDSISSRHPGFAPIAGRRDAMGLPSPPRPATPCLPSAGRGFSTVPCRETFGKSLLAWCRGVAVTASAPFGCNAGTRGGDSLPGTVPSGPSLCGHVGRMPSGNSRDRSIRSGSGAIRWSSPATSVVSRVCGVTWAKRRNALPS